MKRFYLTIAVVGLTVAILPAGAQFRPGNPPKQDPPKQGDPPKQSPPVNNPPPRQSPPANNPPPRQSPPANNPPPRQSPPVNNPPKQSPPVNNPPPRQTPPANNPPKQSPPVNNPPPRQSPPINSPGRQNPPQQAPPSQGGGLQQGNPPRQSPPGNSGSGPAFGDRNAGNPPNQGGRSGNDITQPGPKPGFGDRGRIFNPNVPVADQFKPTNPQGPGFSPKTGGFDTKQNTNVPYGGSQAHKTPHAFPAPSGPRIRDPYFVDTSYYGRNHCRIGYSHYYPWWRDWYFGYRWYVSDPWSYRCYFSPYYWYVSIPAYVRYDRVIIITPRIIVLTGSYLDWRYYGMGATHNTYYGGYGYSYGSAGRPIDRALSNLTDAFRYEDPSLLGNFLTSDSQVNIYIDENYAYTLNGADYYDMTADLIQNVYTTNYQIERVRQARSGEYVVLARHDFVDPNNSHQTVWMTFTLQEYRGHFYIIEAGTSRHQPRI